MGSLDTWKPLAARIRGLTEASQLAANLFTKGNDSLGVIVDLGNHALAILSDLRAFGASLGTSDRFASEAIQRVAARVGPMLVDKDATTDMRQIYVRSSIVIIGALEGELSYLLRDGEETIRSRTERAFEHLSRSIMADDDVREKWKNAYNKNEIACEKLGAVHLLSHGIWAFKVDAIGGRTDLVYQEPLVDVAKVKRSSDGLILTEWKKLADGDDPEKLFEAARNQTRNYAAGVLAGMELTRYRYAILVSGQDIKVPDDFEIAGIIYRHINVAVVPRLPSRR